tara:strand:- start:578 stop:901 length:324 start_codon:yes stop_codon:yes gene_type:complete
MVPPDDGSPTTIDSTIALNIYEESAVFEILQELEHLFPSEGREALRRRITEWIEGKARSGAITFFRRNWPGKTIEELSVEAGIELLYRPETWAVNWDDQFVAYEKQA